MNTTNSITMKNSIGVKIFLALGSFILSAVGFATMMLPVAFMANSGIELPDNVSLINNIRGYGGALLSAGLIGLAGVFISGLRFTSLLVVSSSYIMVALGRIISLMADGAPVDDIKKVIVLELVLGCIGFFLLMKNTNK